jgi:cyclohexanecarboxylate-CoA ligase
MDADRRAPDRDRLGAPFAAVTLWRTALAAADRFGGNEMLVDDLGRRLSFEQVVSSAERIAAGLATRGIGAGRSVSWQLPTRIEALLLTLALSRLGVVQNPILPGYGPRELTFVLAQTRPDLLIAPGPPADAMGVEVLVLDGELPQADTGTLPDLEPVTADTPVRWIFYTSGTTARPKGARHSDASVMAGARALSSGLRCSPVDRIGMTFPVAHIGGCTSWLGASLLSGCTLLLAERFDLNRTVEFLGRERATIPSTGTVFTLAYLAAQRERPSARRFPQLRLMTSGAAPKPPGLHEAVQRELGGMGVMSSWGMTEAPIATMTQVDDPDEVLASTEGRAVAGVQLRVVGTDGVDVVPGQEGELRVRGPQVMLGYVDHTLDAEAFDDAGFLRTGDLARLDPAGNVVITGRSKDVIIRGGEKISSVEIEELLRQNSMVADVAVIGVRDPRLGERPCAVVVATDPTEPPSLGDLTDFLRDRGLRTAALPEQLELLDELPRGATGKVMKAALRERFGQLPA